MIFRKINGEPMTVEQLKKYLETLEIGFPENLGASSEKDLEYLSALQWNHMSHIPYSNIATMKGIPASLKRCDLHDKLIIRKQGGLCSEINTLYNWLLESLGFDVTSFSARITGTAAPIQSQSHRVIRVRLGDNSYLTDAGYNFEHHRIPLLIKDGLVQPDGECEYKLVRDDFFGWVMWQNRPREGWRKKLGFAEEPRIDLDFVPATFYAEFHPDSFINKTTKVSLYIDGCFHAVRGGNYLVEHGGIEKIIEPITSEQQEKRILCEVFGLEK